MRPNVSGVLDQMSRCDHRMPSQTDAAGKLGGMPTEHLDYHLQGDGTLQGEFLIKDRRKFLHYRTILSSMPFVST
jgi:hypothetical protein